MADLVAMRTKVVRDISPSTGLFWIHRLPADPHCFAQAQTPDDEEEAWLRIDKPRPPARPRCPEICQPWLELSSLEQVNQVPQLREEIADPGWQPPIDSGDSEEALPTPHLRLVDHPEVLTAWQRFLEDQWLPWQTKQRHWLLVQDAYSRLFKIYQEQLRRGEQYELRFGFGLLAWVTPRNQRIYHPLITASVAIELEATSGCLRVSPSVDGVNLSLEQDMLEVDERPAIELQHRTREQIQQLGSPWERADLRSLLTAYVHGLHSDAQYEDALEPPTRVTEVPQVCFAPVLILRPRMGRSLRAALQRISEQIHTGGRLPAGIAELVTSDDAPKDLSQRSTAADSTIPADHSESDGILFPLPYNREQEQIIERLGGRTGVLVQGPPGTGKSHTITNLVCHFLAQGRRVLVTSQTPRALKVLRDKFPTEIKPLAVSLLGENQEAMASLEASVQGILRYTANTSLEQLDQAIDVHRKQRCEMRAELARLHTLDAEQRRTELATITIPSTPYRGKAQALAQQLAMEADRYDWFPSAPLQPICPLTAAQLEELFSFWSEASQDRQLLTLQLPGANVLPSVAELDQAVDRLKMVRLKARVTATGNSELHEHLVQLPLAELSALQNVATQLQAAWLELSEALEPWHRQALADLRGGNRLDWQELSQNTAETLERHTPSVRSLPAVDELPPGVTPHQALADAEDLLAHLAQRRSLGIWILRPKVVRRTAYLWSQFRINGRLADTPAALEATRDYFRLLIEIEATWSHWSVHQAPPNGSLARQVTALRQAHQQLQTIHKIVDVTTQLADRLRALSLAPPPLQGRPQTDLFLQAIERARHAQEERQVRDRFSELVSRVQQAIREASLVKFRDRLATDVRQGDTAAYGRHLQKLAALHERKQRAETVAGFEELLQRAGAKPLVAAIHDPQARAALRDRLDHLGKAWQWRFARNWLDQHVSQLAQAGTAAARQAAEAQLAQATENLVAAKTWRGTQVRLQANRSLGRALVAWEKLVKKLGRTGKYAESNRRAAREQMQQCRSAIPAWIMPLHRVVEQIEMEPEIYDVVIVDEASQTGPEGLLLQYLAKQCIIVGDDKQISPEGGFIDQSQVQLLIQQHLADDPLAATLKPQFSLFEQAAIRYGTRTTLREHFRCVPEIIRFSNDLCYQDTPLVPLRQYAPTRLDPLVVCRVIDGYREGRDSKVINRPEAAAIVHQVQACLQQPEYSGKSFGVVCLQGQEQARLIEHLLLEAVGPEPFKDPRRQLLCGDPYSFQGDERDVVFLSLVAALEGDRRFAAMTRETYRQRFNVAVSRARDQVWLFHSVDIDDLNPNCMRRKLLEYFYNPSMVALTTDLSRCESQFERDVAEALVARGYRVLPQFEVAGRRIDLVVEDNHGRIAIECNGDVWHGPERWDHDMQRQRILERCGWRFLRIRGSQFYARPTPALDELCASLTHQGIQPLRAGAAAPNQAQTVLRKVSGIECLEALGKQVAEKPENTIALEPPPGTEEDDREEPEFELTPNGLVHELESDGKELLEEADDEEESSDTSPPTEAELELVAQCLADAGEPLKRAQILFRTSLPESRWTVVRSELLARERIMQWGERKGARYALAGQSEHASQPAELGPEDKALIYEVVKFPAAYWGALSHWAKVNGHLEAWQRSLAYSLGQLRRNGRLPSLKQARQGLKIVDLATRHGFRVNADQLPTDRSKLHD
ncbi:MAG: AAA family ATPase [Pirellulales bacterium]|nr:AAA family ATPase [Pirellulales bacterium]